MARVAKMPDVQRQKKGNGYRFIIKKRWPKEVRAQTGKDWFRHPFPIAYSEEQAHRERAFVLERDFWPVVEEARGRIHRNKEWDKLAPFIDGVSTERFTLLDFAVMNQTRRPDKHSGEPVDCESMIREWIDERTIAGTPPKNRAVKNRRSKLEKLFTWLRSKRGFTGGNDMLAVRVEDLQAYKESLPANLRFDAFTEISATWGVAERNNKLPNGNPCDKIHIPKPKKGTRKPFEDVEARDILEFAACSDDPLIRWGHWLAAFTGTIIEEVIGARKDEFRLIDGIWVWDFTERTGLKTAYRPRGIPIHPALIRMGFIDWVMAQPDGLLFRVAPHRASKKLMDSIRDLGITDPAKVHYSWRHRFISAIHDLTTADRSRFLAGHAAKDVHARHYLHHELIKLVEAVNGLQDPTVDRPQKEPGSSQRTPRSLAATGSGEKRRDPGRRPRFAPNKSEARRSGASMRRTT